MIKTILSFALASALLTACNNDSKTDASSAESSNKTTEIINSLKEENQELKAEINHKDSTLTQYISYINEIRSNLDLIKEKQKFIINKKMHAENLKADDNDLVEEIKLLGKLMAENHSKINHLKANLKDAHLKMDGLEDMILSLNEDVEEKNMEIFQLQQELENVDAAFSELFEAYTQKATMLNEANTKLHMAWYTVGTKSELLENEVITKEGGVLGVGATKELKDDFNKSYFTEINTDEVKEIPLGSKKVELITKHPSSSYELIGENPVEKLVIKDADSFWSVSKFLVIMVK